MAINTVEKEEKNTEEDCRDPINLQTKPCVDMLHIIKGVPKNKYRIFILFF